MGGGRKISLTGHPDCNVAKNIPKDDYRCLPFAKTVLIYSAKQNENETRELNQTRSLIHIAGGSHRSY